MKESIYNHRVNIEDNKVLLYNLLTRKYHIYNEKDNLFNSTITNMNKSNYSLEEFDLLKSLLKKGFLVSDDTDEIEKIKFAERNIAFQDRVFNLTIQPTLDCNFRCTYCYENHLKTTIDDDVEEKIIKFVEKKSKDISKLDVTWFGGEPMMRFDTIKRMSKKMKEVCNRNGCEYSENMVTNGYLFNDKIIEDIKKLSFTRFQVTIDGDKESHDKQRPLVNGNGTFEKVTENILKLIDNNFAVTFRINISDENINSIPKILDLVPEEKRKNVVLSINNLFQCKKHIKLFNLYKLSIDKGYVFAETKNVFFNCFNACKNAITVEPDGKCSICSCISEDGLVAGYLNEDGELIINKPKEYIAIKNCLATDREMCLSCKKLPMCMGACAYGRYNNKDFCPGQNSNGLSLDDKIYLHYYYDLISNKNSLECSNL